MLRLLAHGLTIAFLAASPALPAPAKLGPEVPIGTATFGPAAYSQTLSSVASNGRGYVALWTDERAAFASGRAALYVGRVDAQGRPIDPRGRKLADAAIGRITWTGSNYVVVYTVQTVPSASFMQLLDADANPSGAPVTIDVDAPAREIVSNGSTLLIVGFGNNISLHRLDGSVIEKTIWTDPTDVSALLMPNGDYRLVSLRKQCDVGVAFPCAFTLEVTELTGSLHSYGVRSIAKLPPPGARAAAAATTDGRILVAANSNGTLLVWLIDAKGNVGGATRIAGGFGGADPVSVGFDGQEFLVTVSTANGIRGFRVGVDGQLIDASPLLSTTPGTSPLFARSSSGVLIAWSDYVAPEYDVVARAVRSFAELGGGQTNVLASSAAPQFAPKLAAGAEPLAVWSEGTRPRVLAQLPGHDVITLSGDQQVPPASAVARGQRAYLAVWTESGGTIRLFAKRIGFGGTAIDAQPIAIAEVSGVYNGTPLPLAVAFDGTNYLVVWEGEDTDLRGARISENGVLLDANPIVISHLGPHFGTPASVRVVWTGTQYIVGWLDQLYSPLLISPPPPMPALLRFVRVTSSGEVLDANPRVVWQQGMAPSLAMATNGNGAVALWAGAADLQSTRVCVWGTTVHDDGTTGPVRELVCGATYRDVDVAWNGSEYVAAFAGVSTPVFAERLDAALNALDAAPVAVTETNASQPAVAATANGVTIAYVRLATEPQFGDVPRIFARTLDRLAAVGRRRATSR